MKKIIMIMLLLNLVACQTKQPEKVIELPEVPFDEFIDTTLAEEISDDYSYSFAIYDYSLVNAEKPEPKFDEFLSEEALFEEQIVYTNELLKYQNVELDHDQKSLYTKLLYNDQIMHGFIEYNEFSFLFIPGSSIVDNAITIFTHLDLINQERIDDYFALLNDFVAIIHYIIYL